MASHALHQFRGVKEVGPPESYNVLNQVLAIDLDKILMYYNVFHKVTNLISLREKIII